MKKIILIAIFAAALIPLSAQKYGFYGRNNHAGRVGYTGKSFGRSSGSGSYHSGTNGTYIGFHPDGVSHSRNSFQQQYLGSDDSRRSGFNVAAMAEREAEKNLFKLSTSQVTRDEVRVNSNAIRSHHRASANGSVTRTNLGVSARVTDLGSHHVTGGGGSSTTGVNFGRTSNSSSLSDKAMSFLGMNFSSGSSSSSSYQEFMAPPGDQGSSQYQDFMAPPGEEAPLGDALLPLLLLILPVVIYKIQSLGTVPCD